MQRDLIDVDIPADFRAFLDQQQQQDPNNPNGTNNGPLIGTGQGDLPREPDGNTGTNAPNADGNWDISDPNLKKDKGNSESPRESQGPSSGAANPGNPDFPNFNTAPIQPQSVTPPSPEAHQGPLATPPQPMAPSPLGMSGNSQPVTPLPAPTPQEMVAPPQQFDQLGGGSMLGSAGGLLGGGLGTAGGQTSGADENNILPLLLQLLAQQKG